MAKEKLVEEQVIEEPVVEEVKAEKKTSKKLPNGPVKAMAVKIVSGQFGTGDTLQKAIKDAGLNEKEVMAAVKALR